MPAKPPKQVESRTSRKKSSANKESSPTDFEKKCYDLMRKIPKGKITTYKDLARAMGTTAYRAVGNACRKNPNAPKVPCHRVVKSDGSLGGYAYGLKKKRQILKREGIDVTAEGSVNLDKFGHKFK